MVEAYRYAWTRFYEYHRYTIEKLELDYQNELKKYNDAHWEAPQRAARLSAAVKRYKTSQMLCFVFIVAQETGLDFTPLAVKRLCNNLFGRTGSQAVIVDIFGQEGRGHKSKDSSPEAIQKLAIRYRSAADTFWSSTLKDIAQAKVKYQTAIKASNR